MELSDFVDHCRAVEAEGDGLFAAGDFRGAIKKYEKAYSPMASNLANGELAHKVALAYLNLGDYPQYLDYEEQAGSFYGDFSPDQAADFLKAAGDNLALVDGALAGRAYGLAEKYYAEAAAQEKDESDALAWMAWSAVCKARTAKSRERKAWSTAANLFTNAANRSPEEIRKSRMARAYQCQALAALAAKRRPLAYGAAEAPLRAAAELSPSGETELCLKIMTSMAGKPTVEAVADLLDSLSGTGLRVKIPLQLSEPPHVRLDKILSLFAIS